MRTRLKYINGLAIFLIIGILSVSCLPTRSLIIDIPHQATRELPPEVQSLALVSQAVDDRFTNLDSDSLQKIFYQKRFNLDTVIYDFQMADTTLKVLGELLFESGRYDYVIPEARFLKPSTAMRQVPELKWEDVTAIADTFDTDAVLSLDFLRTQVVTGFNNSTRYRPTDEGFYSGVTANMKIYYEAMVRVYYPQKKQILLRELIRDTLYWEDADVSVSALFDRFTPVKKALTESGIAIALDLTEKVAVRWRPERRRYFTSGNALIKQGDQTAMNGDWQKAISIWKEAAQTTKSKTVRSKAQLNIALGYEIAGDVDQAIKWALDSYESMYRPLTYEYLETLKRRKTELTRTR